MGARPRAIPRRSNTQVTFAGEAKAGVEATLTGLTVLDAEISAHIPPIARARAGAVVGRMLKAGYTARQANLAISALYVSRNQRALVKLWGMLDRERWGAIDTGLFDRTMLLFSDVLEDDQLPELRAQLGFVNPAEVTLREFEAALRLLVHTHMHGAAPAGTQRTHMAAPHTPRTCTCRRCRPTAHQPTCVRSTPTYRWPNCSEAWLAWRLRSESSSDDLDPDPDH